jgi:hypothetical protein
MKNHFLSSFAGIQPETPGFSTVRIDPKFGHLNKIKVKVAHPQGIISMNLIKQGKEVKGDIELPEGLQGTLYWADDKINLTEGRNEIRY